MALKLSALNPNEVEEVGGPSTVMGSAPLKLSSLKPEEIEEVTPSPVSPSMADQAWDKAKEFGSATVDNLSGLGAMAGGVVGGALGNVPGAVAGAGVGGYLGEAGKNLIHQYTAPELAPKTSKEFLTEPLIAGAGAAAGEVLGHGLGAVAGKAFKLLPKAGSKVGELLTGIPEKEIETYATQTGMINKMIKESGGDVTVAADNVRQKLQTGVRNTKNQLNKQISEHLNLSPTQPTISTDPIVMKLEVAKAKLNPQLQEEAVSQIDDMITKLKSTADPDGKVNLKTLQDIKNYLNDQGKSAYLKGGQIFSPASQAQQAAKRAAKETLDIINPLSPEIQAANRQLQKLHMIEDNLNKNLIAPGKPEGALLAAGQSGGKGRNASMLRRLGEMTGQDALGEAENLATVKRFASPSLAPADVTGKSAMRLGAGTMIGGALGGIPGAAVGGALTSPMALKGVINAGDMIRNIAKSAGNTEVFGKFAPVIQAAMQRGPEALAVAGTMLSQNPEFRQMLDVLSPK